MRLFILRLSDFQSLDLFLYFPYQALLTFINLLSLLPDLDSRRASEIETAIASTLDLPLFDATTPDARHSWLKPSEITLIFNVSYIVFGRPRNIPAALDE